MHLRTLGKTGFEVSEVGFGAWAIGADWGDTVPAEQAKRALGAAVDAGVNLIDTADVYGAGRSETLIGEFLTGRQDDRKPFIITKMGRWPDWKDSLDSVQRAAERSLERLGVDALDLVQLHCIPTDTLKAGRAFDHLEKIKEAGLIRHYGASVETIEEALFCIDHGGPAALQVIFNIFRQRLVEEVLPAAQRADVGIIARVPLASGVLSGKYSAESKFGADDHRNFNADGACFNVGETFAGVPFADAVRFADRVAQLLQDECPTASLAQKSLRWILDHEAVSTVIPGAKSAVQAEANAAASDLPPLSGAAHSALRSLYREEVDAAVRGVY